MSLRPREDRGVDRFPPCVMAGTRWCGWRKAVEYVPGWPSGCMLNLCPLFTLPGEVRDAHSSLCGEEDDRYAYIDYRVAGIKPADSDLAQPTASPE